MEPWLDSLSEDWNSQPRDSSSLPSKTPSLPSDDASFHSHEQLHQSRIPRSTKNSLGSSKRNGFLRTRSFKKQSQKQGDCSVAPVLGEHSSSKLNVQAQRASAEPERRSLRRSSLPRSSSRAASESSGSGPVPPHMSHKGSVVRAEGAAQGETPEWKRRLIHGEGVLSRDQKDLFAPMELENMFRPPTVGKKNSILAGPKTRLQVQAPWSNLSESTQNSAHHDFGFSTKKGSTMKKPNMDVLEEASEEGSLRARSESAPGSFNIGPEDDSADARPVSPRTLDQNAASNEDPRARTVSGQEEIRNEEISPIIISKTNSTRDANYGAYTLSMRRLHGRLEDIASVQRDISASRLSDHDVNYTAAGEDENPESAADIQTNDWTSQSLPEDLSMGTPDIVSHGPFVNTRRGGYSRDGSFLHRNLSASSFPSSLQPSMKPHSNDQRGATESTTLSQLTEKAPPAAPTPPVIPSSPPVVHKTPSSGSPLKIFGKHDTFTNDRLLKRMSQYAEHSSGDIEIIEKEAEIKERSDLKSSGAHVGQFGGGQLDEYDFQQNLVSTPDQTNSDGIGSPTLPPNTQRRQHMFKLDQLEIQETGKRLVRISRQSSADRAQSMLQRSERTKQRQASAEVTKQTPHEVEHLWPLEGKRTLNSPERDPVVKRRRTLLTEEVNELSNQLQSATVAEAKPVTTKPLAGQKRKDARDENSGRRADPAVLANRQILRPRNPTPGQAKTYIKQEIARHHPQIANEPEIQSFVEQLDEGETTATESDSKTEAVAEELASFGVGVAQMMTETRKGSVTTQDFLAEATKIMEIIRARNRPLLEGVEESVGENKSQDSPSLAESSIDQFSRPPSREGLTMRRVREPQNVDPRVMSHLRKFKDKEDLTQDCIQLDDQGQGDPHDVNTEQDSDTQAEEIVVSSPSNIRIRDNPTSGRKRKQSDSTVPEASNREQADVLTHSSSGGESTNRTIPTASSSSSGLKGMIASDKVAHLIPEQIGAMTFDKAKHVWIKNHRSFDKGSGRKARTESTEDDPFEDIPDLSVDEMEELRRRESIVSTHHAKAAQQNHAGEGSHPLKQMDLNESRCTQTVSGDSRPHTRDGGPPMPLNTSSAPSKESRFDFSIAQPGTRATSWGDEGVVPKENARHVSAASGPESAPSLEEVEHEIRIHEGRVSTVPNQHGQDNHQPRAVTIAFSSPLVSHIGYQDGNSSFEYESLLGPSIDSPTSGQFRPLDFMAQPTTTHHSEHHRGFRKPTPRTTRRMSLDSRPFTARPISRIEEQNEDSPREYSMIRQADEDKIVATPAQNHTAASTALVPSANASNWSFHLSPLPDFSVNQVDYSQHLEVSYIAGRMHHSSLRQVHGTYALAVEDLVKHITDVEPYEPYWEYLRRLDLSGKGLITLHRLREFCYHIEDLDISDNEIGQLADVPHSVRSLRTQRNCLTSLTSWGHLTNLQYLDVSGNQLESLEGFGSLVHLRELKADGNKIRNIDGILDLDGLLVLRLRENQLAAVDFEASELLRLRELNLSGNELTSIRNLEYLPSLEALDLSRNRLDNLSHLTAQPLPRLQSLRLTSNKLTTLDLEFCPNLRLLYLDNNSIISVTNVSELARLDSLSLREQSYVDSNPPHVDLPSNETRKLYLSSNLVPSTPLLSSSPTLPFLNLQYLELSSAGLQSLPDYFGCRVPNVRTLNLNFNALKDITPLLGILRLNRLLLAGNRLSRLRKTCMILARFKALTKLDLRNNPLTLGFYPPLPPAADHRVTTLRDTPNQIQNCSPSPRDLEGLGLGLADPELQDPYALPPADEEADAKYLKSLDQGTKMRRRVAEVLLAMGNEALKEVDGLRFHAEEVFGRRDDVWEGMIRKGVLKIKGGEDGKTIGDREEVEGGKTVDGGGKDEGEKKGGEGGKGEGGKKR